jgi:hypothetical protein
MPAAFSGGRVSDAGQAAFTPEQAAARTAAAEKFMEERAERMARRAQGLPASDPRVQAGPPPNAAEATTARGALKSAAGPGPLAPGDLTFFRATQITPPAGFGSSVAEPAVAQSGRRVVMTYNWYSAFSFLPGDGGQTFAQYDPAAVYPGMPDFCCDQDVLYDHSADNVVWERLGIGGFACGAGCTQNRVLLTILASDFNSIPYVYDVRGTIFGLSNAFLDYPRMAFSNKYLYISFNVFDWTSGAFRTHLIVRLDRDNLNNQGVFSGNFWTFTDGWSPASIENARDTMFFGDQIVTSSGLNDQFRIYWAFDDSATLFGVDRTITPYLFTNRFGAHCPVPGGVDPCQRSDQRVTGGALVHHSPSPNGLGAAGDKIDFFWNVREGNGFTYPYIESATFHAGTLAYTLRKLIYNTSYTWFYGAAGANDDGYEGLSLLAFFPPASGTNPYHAVGIDDDYNGNPPGWEVYFTYGGGAWNASQSGDYLRARIYSPMGIGWAVSGYSSVGAAGNNYRPHYLVFGRQRDLDGFLRYDQQ